MKTIPLVVVSALNSSILINVENTYGELRKSELFIKLWFVRGDFPGVALHNIKHQIGLRAMMQSHRILVPMPGPEKNSNSMEVIKMNPSAIQQPRA